MVCLTYSLELELLAFAKCTKLRSLGRNVKAWRISAFINIFNQCNNQSIEYITIQSKINTKNRICQQNTVVEQELSYCFKNHSSFNFHLAISNKVVYHPES